MKGKVVKALVWIISILAIIMCIKVIVDNEQWWKMLLATVGIVIAVAINENCFLNLKQYKKDKNYKEQIKKAESLISQNEYIEAKSLLNELDMNYNELFVKRDILRIENEIDYVLGKRIEIDGELDIAEEFANNNQFEKCKNFLDKKVIWFEGYDVIFNEFLSEDQKSRGLDLLRRCIII